jgi:hypothetical protein
MVKADLVHLALIDSPDDPDAGTGSQPAAAATTILQFKIDPPTPDDQADDPPDDAPEQDEPPESGPPAASV